MCHSSMLICFPFENFVPFMSPLQIFKILFPPFTEKKKSNTMYVKQQKWIYPIYLHDDRWHEVS